MSKPKRIYLIAKYSAKPKDPKLTRFAGYVKDSDNMAWDEQIRITLGLKEKDFLSAKVVLNISEQKVERNSFNKKSFIELFEYFYKASPDYISQALRELGVRFEEEKNDKIEEHVPTESKEGEGSKLATTTNTIGS